MNIAIIPARGGSRRIKRKNIRDFHGKPIIAYSIDAAIRSGLFDDVVVSTEDNEIAQIARNYGASTPFTRPNFFAHNEIGTQEVAQHAMLFMKDVYQKRYEYGCVIYATSPMISIDDLAASLEALKASDRKFVFSIGSDGRDAGQFYWGRSRAFIDNLPLHENADRFVVDGDRVCDINTEEDWDRAESMYKNLKGF